MYIVTVTVLFSSRTIILGITLHLKLVFVMGCELLHLGNSMGTSDITFMDSVTSFSVLSYFSKGRGYIGVYLDRTGSRRDDKSQFNRIKYEHALNRLSRVRRSRYILDSVAICKNVNSEFVSIASRGRLIHHFGF